MPTRSGDSNGTLIQLKAEDDRRGSRDGQGKQSMVKSGFHRQDALIGSRKRLRRFWGGEGPN